MSNRLKSKRCAGVIAAGTAITGTAAGIGAGIVAATGGTVTGAAAITIIEMKERAENSALCHFEARKSSISLSKVSRFSRKARCPA